MTHGLKLLFAGILVWGAGTGAASADSYRVPKTGTPALAVAAPPGWTVKYTTDGVMIVSAESEMAILEASVISDAGMAAKPLADVAREVFRLSDLPRWTDTEPQSLAGHPGQAFLINVRRSGTDVAVRVIIAKIDAGHAARITEIAVPKLTTKEQLAGLNQMVSHLGITGR